MLKKIIFCHDHQVSIFKGEYYSPGKLDYSKFSFYLEIFDSMTIVTRGKEVNSFNSGLSLVTGLNVKAHILPNLSSLKGLLFRKKIKNVLSRIISNNDAIIARLPSEIGLMSISIAKEMNKPILIEVVASAYDCLKYRGDITAKLYAPLLELRMKKACVDASFITYVTNDYLQSKYPSSGNQIAISDAGISDFKSPRLYPKTNSISIGIIGNPDLKLKGIKNAIDAISNIKKIENINISLKVLGGKGHNYIDTFGEVPDWCSFDGVLIGEHRVNNWLDTLDIYIQPSLTEGLPRSLVEAMSRGLPCIGSRVGGIPELLPDSSLFEAGSEESLRLCLLSLLKEKNKYEDISSRCYLKALEFDKNLLLNKRTFFYNQFQGEEIKNK